MILGVAITVAAEPDLPTSVVHTRDGQKHFYSVADIFEGSAFENPSFLDSYYTPHFPDSLEASIDRKHRTFAVSTYRALTVRELQNAFDEAAREGGDLPYWTELQLRDTPKAPSYAADLFRVKPFEREFPKGLAWFLASSRDSLRLPIGLALDHQGTVLVSHSTAHCMAHDRFAIRIMDADGRLLWQDHEVALASCAFAVVDLDGDGLHEILINRDDHGTRARFVIANASKHALHRPGAAVTPAVPSPPPAPSTPRSSSTSGAGR